MDYPTPDVPEQQTSWTSLRTFSIDHAADIYNVRHQTLYTLQEFAEFWAKKHGHDAVIMIGDQARRVVSKQDLE